MAKEIRQVVFDPVTGLEANRFKGVMQSFPNHFHEHYVLGFIEKGRRHMRCKNRDYPMGPGDLLLLNPRENHACTAVDDKALDYRSLNVPAEVLCALAAEVTGRREAPHFSQPTVRDAECRQLLHSLHRMVLHEREPIGKQETLLLLVAALLARHTDGEAPNALPQPPPAVELAAQFLEEHFAEGQRMQQLGELAGLNQYALLRAFTRAYGITPYRYLQTVRVNRAKAMLEAGAAPAEAAADCGFADQSHFTRTFKSFTGLTPFQYSRIFKEGKPTDGK